jgi:hypothetical protein
VQSEQLRSLHWDIAKLLEMGVSPDIVSRMNPEQVRDMLKGLLYLQERYRDLAE